MYTDFLARNQVVIARAVLDLVYNRDLYCISIQPPRPPQQTKVYIYMQSNRKR